MSHQDKNSISLNGLESKFVFRAGVKNLLINIAKEIYSLNQKIEKDDAFEEETFVENIVEIWMKEL